MVSASSGLFRRTIWPLASSGELLAVPNIRRKKLVLVPTFLN